ncbi:unnamed protein product [Lactuca virosa]|uniref:F-box associated beta-propeller type 1 domain-containing protein n=1 Tax=Lactuca virosa TaxID=75947 RepID=A0AAU9MHF4_9ASTR|nr:unnamed protein product [Lactuca virosa]
MMAEVELMTTELPPDIIFTNILPRVTAKYVLRFKCVSKQWHSFLMTPGFLQMHQLHVNSNPNDLNQKFFFLTSARPWEYRTIDCETPKDGFTASRPFPFQVEVGKKISIVTSLNGMVCVGINKPWPNDTEYSDLILWNPLTDDHKTLSNSKPGCPHPYRVYTDEYALYYSSSENDYKLVWLTSGRLMSVYIYSLRSDSWRKVESTHNAASYQFHLIMSSVMWNEKFHFLRKLFHEFEGAGEKLLNQRRTDFMGFMVLRGCIHLCVAIINASIDEYDTIELWSGHAGYKWERVTEAEPLSSSDIKIYTDLHPILHLVIRKGHNLLHRMRNGKWLMYSRFEEHVYTLDASMDNHTKDIMCSIGLPFCPSQFPGAKYVETLVSPNQYMK